MQCARCGRDNPAHGQFCLFCGAPLGGQGPGEPSEASSSEEGGIQLSGLLSEVSRVRAQLEGLTTRLSAVERFLGMIPSLGGAAAQPSLRVSPSVEGAGGTTLSTGTALQAGSGDWDWEWLLGGNWLARIGVVALILGVGFFLKLAFDNDWIGETGRVVLGILGGIALVALGEFSQRRYPAWAQALTGGGIAILYLSLYAAFSFYQLLDTLPTFGFMFLVTITASALALRYESVAIAVLGIMGGFATPLMLWEELPDQRILLGYVLVLDLGVLALATFRTWRWFTLLGLAGSAVLYGFWYAEFGYDASLLLAQGGLTLIFLVFVGATSLFHLLWQRRATEWDYSLMLLNASFYTGVSYGLLWDDYREWVGGFTLLLALFYGLLAYGALRRGSEQAPMALLISGIALVLITVAVPVQLDGPWISIAWASEAAVLMWTAFHLGVYRLRLLSLGVLAVLAVQLLAVESWVEQEGFRLIFNHRVAAFAAGIVSVYAGAYLAHRFRQFLRRWETELPSYLLLVASILTLWLLSVEAISYFEPQSGPGQEGLGNAQTLSLSVIWAVYGSVALTLGMLRGWTRVRLGGLALLGIVILKVFLVDSFALEQGYRVAAYMSLGGLLVAGGLLYQRYGETIRSSLLK